MILIDEKELKRYLIGNLNDKELLDRCKEVEVVGNIISLSDNELMLVSDEKLKEMKQAAIDFDGFESWIFKGKLIKTKE